jgi:hypothetical protein
MGRPKPVQSDRESWHSITPDFIRGATLFTGSAAAKQAAEEVRAGDPRFFARCGRQCGSMLRGVTQEAADRAAAVHAANPDVCTRHPDRKWKP